MPEIWEGSLLDELLVEIAEYNRYHKLELYRPYPFQKAFHKCPQGEYGAPFQLGEGRVAPVRGLIAGNKVGKTECAGYEVAMHLTGLYPDWWEGERFSYPVEFLIAGHTNEKTRDICQKVLFGEPTDKGAIGTGAVPKHCVGEVTRKPGVPNAFDNVLVRHVSGGWSKAMFQAYKQEKGSFMGIPIDGGWLDEEPPKDIFNQFVRGTIAKTKSVLLVTFTPENGATDFVYEWLNDLGPGRGLVRAGWRDAPHIWDVPGKVDELRALFPKYEWEMRENGSPVMGTGRVFQVAEEDITVKPFEIPHHWSRIVGIDFGMDHPFAAVWLAHDRDNDIYYVYDCIKRSNLTIAESASILKRHGEWMPVIWPHDMAKREPKSGQTIKTLFQAEGVNMALNPFSNPPKAGQKEGQGGNSVTAGLVSMQEWMALGQFKVFANLIEWFDEFRNYHTENGVIVKKRDDLMDATRYAALSVRHAKTAPARKVVVDIPDIGGWMGA